MRRFLLAVPILLLAACDQHAPPPPKTSVDVALQCLETLATCEDWEPQNIPGLPPEDCVECDRFDHDCEWSRNQCLERNRRNAPSKGRSVCQAKAEACVRLVEASSPEKEVHHHR